MSGKIVALLLPKVHFFSLVYREQSYKHDCHLHLISAATHGEKLRIEPMHGNINMKTRGRSATVKRFAIVIPAGLWQESWKKV